MQELLNHPHDKKIGNYSFSFQASIGNGSFSIVYLGVDPADNPVAVKVIDKKKINHEYYAGLLNNEIKAMKKLVHKNIVRLFDVLHTNNNFYIVTEFCEGGDLAVVMAKKKMLDVNEALGIFRDILEGFKEMNSHCIIHRDIKPPNIYISKGVYKIGDFGFAKVVPGLYEEIRTPLIGTPLYTPPQCLQEFPYTSKCDLWSLGVVFFEMLYGRTPWNAQNHLELIQKYYTQPLMIPEGRQIPAFCLEFIRKAIVINEAHRISWEEVFSHEIYKPQTSRIQFSNIENVVNIPNQIDYLQKSFTKVNKDDNKKAFQVQLTFSSNENSITQHPVNKETKEIIQAKEFKEEEISVIETVRRQIDFLATQNIVGSVGLEKLRFLVMKHRFALERNCPNQRGIVDYEKQFEALYYVLSCNSTFVEESEADPIFASQFNRTIDINQISSIIPIYLKAGLRELNHEIHFQDKSSILYSSLLTSLTVFYNYLDILQPTQESTELKKVESMKFGEMSHSIMKLNHESLKRRIYEENL